MQQLNWDDLRYVLAVGRRTTLAAAGRDLRVAPTTVGRRILAIEEALGTRLFDRTGEGLKPTHTGRIAMERAEDIELQATALVREVHGSDRRIEGPVRITALDNFVDLIVIPHLSRLFERHPGLEITLVSDMRQFDLPRREADIAIRGAAPTHPDLVGRRLGRQAITLYAARDFDIGDAPPLIGPPRDLDGPGFSDTLLRHFPQGRIVAGANTERHMLELVRAGVGIGLLDCFAGDGDPRLRRAVGEPAMMGKLWAVVHMDMHRTTRVRAVMDFLGEIVALEAGRMEGQGAEPGED
ncbi:MAG: LysR family transcriptional regulator [Alphaproteobacteria bacterium]